MDIWSWIRDLPNSADWSESDSPPTFQLTPNSTKSILLKAESTAGSSTDTLVTFSICINGYETSNIRKTLWVSNACPLSSDRPFLPLVIQLVQETISRSPTAHDSSICARSRLEKLKPEPISWIVESHSPESFSSFFNLIFLCRLFWLCACDAPAEIGSVFVKTVLGPNLDPVACKHVLRTFLVSIGVDAELCFVRTFGYMLVKWLMLRDVGVGLQQVVLTPLLSCNGLSYGLESHGLWILKGYSPVLSMTRTRFNGEHLFEANEAVLKYALGHQQLEAVIQLEYSVTFLEGFINVKARIDNIRLQVVNLGFNNENEGEFAFAGEKYFPSRVRVWVGPEVGATYVGGLSLGKCTENPEREIVKEKVLKGNFGKIKSGVVKARAKAMEKTKTKNWKWEQDAEGHVAIFEGILYDNVSGIEVAISKTAKNDFRRRYSGANRAFNKRGGLVLVGDEGWGEGVGWRLGREMDGNVLKWRLGGKVWLSYWPNEMKSDYFETKCVEWCEEVDLPLLRAKQN